LPLKGKLTRLKTKQKFGYKMATLSRNNLIDKSTTLNGIWLEKAVETYPISSHNFNCGVTCSLELCSNMSQAVNVSRGKSLSGRE
jgi:hypothetical protein